MSEYGVQRSSQWWYHLGLSSNGGSRQIEYEILEKSNKIGSNGAGYGELPAQIKSKSFLWA